MIICLKERVDDASGRAFSMDERNFEDWFRRRYNIFR